MVIQAHIFKKAEEWARMAASCYLEEIVYAEHPSGEYGIIYHTEGFGKNATEYSVIHLQTKKILSKHRMFIHAQKRCYQLNNDRNRYFYACRKIALFPSGGLLRQENCPANYYPTSCSW